MDYRKQPGRIWAENQAGEVIAEITFPECGGVAVIDHTFVDGSLRGQGIAGELMRAAVDQILSEGHRIAATCSYAVSWLQKHPEIPSIPSDAAPACKLGGRH